MTRKLIIGSRGSKLALWQAEWVKGELERLCPHCKFTIRVIKTTGDKFTEVALAKIGDKGLFTKEIEAALVSEEVDMAVHSMKDLPTKLPAGLKIGAVCRREEPGDVLISKELYTLKNLPRGARVGTSSLRRRAQLLIKRPDLNVEDLRGNVNTRIRKMDEEGLHAIILAAAGVIRLGLKEMISSYISHEDMLPAVGQGSIGVEIRENDREVEEIVQCINHKNSFLSISAERAFLARLEGGCQVPIGALGSVKDSNLVLKGIIASLDGKQYVRDAISGPANDAEKLGAELAESLLNKGADKILEAVRRETDAND